MASQATTLNKTTMYTDIDPTFGMNPKTGDLLLVKDERSVRQAISNLLNTSFGERLFHPTIGGSLRNLLFEPIDAITTLELKDRILQTIRKHEPRVGRIDVDVVAHADENFYNVNVEFSLVATGSLTSMSVVLERIR